jgi:N-carbamoylputrescine amidase
MVMKNLVVGAVQIACSDDLNANLNKLELHVRSAAARGAKLVVLQELFEGSYFCVDIDAKHMSRAKPLENHSTISRFSSLARELGVVLPVSLFERDGARCFNSLVMIDADGRALKTYRKSHIPDSPGYSEKFYFADGDTGFMVQETAVGKIGAGICWDQWFPEAARAMVLGGADILIYPTAIGSEPSYLAWDSRDHWQRVMQGHSGANLTPLIAANRVGVETGETGSIIFYGSSFITDFTGAKAAEADRGRHHRRT